MSYMLPACISGALFGGALAIAGVFAPSVVLAQMRLQDFHMMKVFLTATAGSTVVVQVFNRLKISKVWPRSPSSLGVFSRYDGNIIGGLMIGFGMALAGACPGTVFAQLGAGIPSAYLVLGGGVLGAILHAGGLIDWVASRIRTKQLTGKQPTSPAAVRQPADTLTVHGKLGISTEVVFLTFEAMLAGFISVVTLFLEQNHVSPQLGLSFPQWLIGGGLVAVAQAASLLLVGGTLGASAFYADAARSFWQACYWLTGTRPTTVQPPAYRNFAFVAGLVGAAWVVTTFQPDIAFAPSQRLIVHGGTDIHAFLGGVFLGLGARIAGGCTSGHGISGMSSLSLSSFISVAAMFGGGMGLSVLL